MRHRPDFHVILLCAAVACVVQPAAPTQAGAVEPGEVTGVRWDADKVTLRWDAEPTAGSYTVYRGYVQDLAPNFFGTTLEPEITTLSLEDPDVPAQGWPFFHVVTASNASGEGTMGTGLDAAGSATPRPNVYAWPGYGAAGEWGGLRAWPSVAVHSALLHTGQVITWDYATPSSTETVIYDPVSNTMQFRTASANMFCAGHVFLPNGNLLSISGTLGCCPFLGGIWTGLFDPVALAWTAGPEMADGRWYPTAVALGDGRALAFSGLTVNGGQNPLVEAYTAGGRVEATWQIVNTESALPLYPRMHLLSDGKVFMSAPGSETYSFSAATHSWTFVASNEFGVRSEGTSVLLPPGRDRVMIVGGFHPTDTSGGGEAAGALATETVEVIDLTAPAPAWSYTGPMRFKRMHANAVLLPNGKVLVSGGGYTGAVATYPSEIYDPDSGTWSVVATMKTFRLYHSTALLLPDGRVMSAGSDGNPTAEFYSPGYLFRGPRPQITSATPTVLYGGSISVSTPDAASIDSVVLIRPGAVTHSTNMAQRYVPLNFTAGAGSINATVPLNPNRAPPGYYMLFLVNGEGIPSEAEVVLLR